MDDNSTIIETADLGGICAVCGEELTPFGSREIADGLICRNCAKKLSEWLSEETLAAMTAEEVIAHLEYRRINRDMLEGFIPAKSAGGKYKLYIDEANESFLISRKRDFVSANADLLKLAAVEKVRSYVSVDAEQNCGDVMTDIDMAEGEIRHLSFRVNEFPGLEADSEEFEKAINDSFEMAELFKDSGVDEERIVVEYGE